MARHARPEEKASAVSMYADGVFITEIAQRTGFGTTTIFRWAQEAGILKSFSERLVDGARTRQFGRECIGKKNVFQTSKGGVWLHTDSTYEYARLSQLEEDDSVEIIARCEYRVPYEFQGKQKTYIPDFQITDKSGSVTVEEVKPKRWVKDEKVATKTAAAVAFFSRIGILFRVVTEDEIGQDRLKTALSVSSDRQDGDFIKAAHERRKIQRRRAQKTLYRKFRAKASPEQLTAFRAQMAAYTRAHRARKSAEVSV